MTTEALLFPLLRNALFGEPVEDKIKQACTPEALEELYKLAVRKYPPTDDSLEVVRLYEELCDIT